jgi:hypothetical protein
VVSAEALPWFGVIRRAALDYSLVDGVTRIPVILSALAALLLAPAARAIPVPIPTCESEADCGPCELCVLGICEYPERVCRCDVECEQLGFASCVLSKPESPLCGGACSEKQATSPLLCGEGIYAWMVERTAVPIETEPALVVVSSEPIRANVSTWTPLVEPASAASGSSTQDANRAARAPLNDGCSVGQVNRPGASLWPIVWCLGLLWRRR